MSIALSISKLLFEDCTMCSYRLVSTCSTNVHWKCLSAQWSRTKGTHQIHRYRIDLNLNQIKFQFSDKQLKNWMTPIQQVNDMWYKNFDTWDTINTYNDSANKNINFIQFSVVDCTMVIGVVLDTNINWFVCESKYRQQKCSNEPEFIWK